MTDSSDDTTEATSGLSRRDILRRSALVGGALVWAAPTVQALSAPAFGAVVSTPPGDKPCESGDPLSVVVALLQCGTDVFLVKYSPQSSTPGEPDECGSGATLPQTNGANVDNTCTAAMAAINDYIDDHGLVLSENDCPSAVVNVEHGSLCIGNGCTVLAWGVHDGSLGNGHKCAYQVGGGDVVYGAGASEVIQACISGTSVCLNKA